MFVEPNFVYPQVKTSDYNCGANFAHYTCYFELIISESTVVLSTLEADFTISTSNGIKMKENIDLMGLSISCEVIM